MQVLGGPGTAQSISFAIVGFDVLVTVPFPWMLTCTVEGDAAAANAAVTVRPPAGMLNAQVVLAVVQGNVNPVTAELDQPVKVVVAPLGVAVNTTGHPNNSSSPQGGWLFVPQAMVPPRLFALLFTVPRPLPPVSETVSRNELIVNVAPTLSVTLL
jgi:hypothetical protein